MNKNLAFRKIDNKIPLFMYTINSFVTRYVWLLLLKKSRFYCAAELAQIIVMQKG